MKKPKFFILTIWLLLNLTLGLLFSINLIGLSRVNAQEKYSLTVNTVGNGNVTLNPDGGTYDDGTNVTLTANPDSGWEFAGWSGDLSGDANPENITIDADKTVTATFTEIPVQYSLTVNTVGNGNVTLNPDGGTYDDGTNVTLTANPDSGWEFAGWSGDLSGDANPENITIDADKTVTATFTEIPTKNPVLTVVISGSGTTNPSPGIHSYEKFTEVIVNTTANAGWMFDYWILDGVNAGNESSYTIVMDKDHNITAVFIDISPPTIEIISPENITYSMTSVDLNFTVDEETLWIAYSLDGGENVTISGNITISELTEISHVIVIYANDTAGNTGVSNFVYFSVDLTPPNISLSSPGETTYFVPNVDLNFTIDEVTTWIGYSLDGQNNVTVTGNTVLSGLSAGSHSVVVFATDSAGNTGSSGLVEFNIYFFPTDTTPPVISITSPQETTYSVSEVGLNYSISEAVVWRAYSLDGSDNVTIFGNTTLSELSEGTHSVVVFATDSAANTGASNVVEFTVSLPTVDTMPPTITINSPQNSTYSSTTADLNFYISEQASWIAYSLDGSNNVTISGNTTISGLTEGSHSIVAFATDTSGNTGTSNTVQFTISIPPVDTTPPIVVITSPQEITYSTLNIALDFTVNEEVNWIGYSLDGQNNVTITGNSVLSGLSEGSHSVVVFANDTAGNSGASEVIQFTVSLPSEDTISPIITINSPVNTTYEISEILLDFSVNEDTSWMGYSLDGNANITISGDAVLSGLSEGSHSVVVFTIDTAGNSGASNKIQFSVSTTPEDTTPPVISITSPQETTYSLSEVALIYSISEPVVWRAYSLDAGDNVTMSGNTTISGLTNGTYSLAVFANDTAGNSGSSEVVQFTISIPSEDITPLTITVNSPENTTYNTNEISLKFTVNEEPTLKFYSLDGEANVTITGSTTLTGLSEGVHNLVIYAEDPMGNIAVSNLITFAIEAEKGEVNQMWVVAVIAIIASVGFIFSTYIAYDLFKSNGWI
jgi:uncharacterized repeat protein (TIGR02543 family)